MSDSQEDCNLVEGEYLAPDEWGEGEWHLVVHAYDPKPKTPSSEPIVGSRGQVFVVDSFTEMYKKILAEADRGPRIKPAKKVKKALK